MESRIVPLLPWGIVNYSAGLTRLRFGQLGLGTVVGGAPKVFAYVALGGASATSPRPSRSWPWGCWWCSASPGRCSSVARSWRAGAHARPSLEGRVLLPGRPDLFDRRGVRVRQPARGGHRGPGRNGRAGARLDPRRGLDHPLPARGLRLPARDVPWALLAATVSPLGPVGSTAGLEYLARRRPSPRSLSGSRSGEALGELLAARAALVEDALEEVAVHVEHREGEVSRAHRLSLASRGVLAGCRVTSSSTWSERRALRPRRPAGLVAAHSGASPTPRPCSAAPTSPWRRSARSQRSASSWAEWANGSAVPAKSHHERRIL